MGEFREDYSLDNIFFALGERLDYSYAHYDTECRDWMYVLDLSYNMLYNPLEKFIKENEDD